MKTRLIRATLVGLTMTFGICSLAACSQPIATAEVGECANLSGLDFSNLTEIPTVDCSEQHDAQVVGKFDLEDGDFPGAEAVEASAQQGCIEVFESFIGIAPADSSLQISYVRPSEQSWNQSSDREVLCFARAKEPTTGSWEGAAI